MNRAETSSAGEWSLSHAVVEAVAEAEDVDPVDLSPPLFEVVEPDALDQLFDESARAGEVTGHVTFVYQGHQVTAFPDGTVYVDEWVG